MKKPASVISHLGAWKALPVQTDFPTDAWTDGRGELLVAQCKGRVLRTRDFGQTWQTLQTDLKWPKAVARDPFGAIYVGDDMGRLNVSRDDGATWTQVKLEKAAKDRNQGFVVTDTHIHLLDIHRVFRCALGTDNWESVVPYKQPEKKPFWLTHLARTENGTWWLTGRVQESETERGTKWSALLFTSPDGWTWTPAPIPKGLSGLERVVSGGNSLWMFDCLGAKFIKSTDAGATWKIIKADWATQASDGFCMDDTFTAIHGQGTLRRTEDGGKTWAVDFEENIRQNALVASASGHLFLINSTAVYIRDEPLAKRVAPALPRVTK